MKLGFFEHEQKNAYVILIPSSEKKPTTFLLIYERTLLVQIQSKLSAFTGFALEQGSQTMVCVPLILHKPFKSGS